MDFGSFRALATIISERLGIASLAGMTHSGKRDVYAALGYKRDLGADDYRSRFRRGGIAKRIVKAFPDATWKGYPELIEDEGNPDLTAFEEAWVVLNKRLKIWPTLRKADVLAGIGRYSIILIGGPGDLNTELKSVRPEDIKFLSAFGEDDAAIESFETNNQNERFGLPLMYRLKRVGGDDKTERLVHWSRVLHVACDCTDDDVYGTPRLEACWNDLDNLDKVVGAGSEAFWLRAHQGYQFNLDKDFKWPEGAKGEELKAEMKEKIDEWVHGLRRALTTKGMDMKAFGSDVADFSNQAAAILELIAATSEIPQRILLGSERGELASDQDEDNWTSRVEDRRTQFAGPYMVRPLVDLFIAKGALPPVEEYDVRWPVTEPTDSEKAELALQYATVNDKAGETVILPNEIRDWALGRDPLDEQELLEENEDLSVEEEDEEEEDDAVGDVPRAAAAKRRRIKMKKRTKRSKRSKSRRSPRGYRAEGVGAV